jgi:hypothetical protein
MPSLDYHDQSTHHGGRLSGRVLIGKRLSHGVVLSDPGVSRLHAWVDPEPAGGWAVTDAGSKTGTFVNDRPTYRHVLVDGDVIRVGSTRITYRAADDLFGGTDGVAFSPPPGQPVRTSGLLFVCGHCRAPIWVGNDLAGKRGRCRHCKQQVVAPAVTEVVDRTPAPATALPGRLRQCGVCHAAIAEGEPATICPECDITYHAECWTENYGCSTYGCAQVDALNPNAPPRPPTPAIAPPHAPSEAAPAEAAPGEPDVGPDPYDDEQLPDESTAGNQMEWVALLGAVLSLALGALLFGVPALAMAVVASAMIVRRTPRTRVWLLVIALIIAVVGVVGGLILSDFVWFHGHHLP